MIRSPPLRVKSRFPTIFNNSEGQYELSTMSSTSTRGRKGKQFQHLYVLPVLLLEFLALALTRAVLPALLLNFFEENVYLVMGCVEFVRGLLAFVACPFFGKISDRVGRRTCLFWTVFVSFYSSKAFISSSSSS